MEDSRRSQKSQTSQPHTIRLTKSDSFCLRFSTKTSPQEVSHHDPLSVHRTCERSEISALAFPKIKFIGLIKNSTRPHLRLSSLKITRRLPDLCGQPLISNTVSSAVLQLDHYGQGKQVLRHLRGERPPGDDTTPDYGQLTKHMQVDPGCSEAQLKTAYKKGALKHHPGMSQQLLFPIIGLKTDHW